MLILNSHGAGSSGVQHFQNMCACKLDMSSTNSPTDRERHQSRGPCEGVGSRCDAVRSLATLALLSVACLAFQHLRRGALHQEILPRTSVTRHF